MIVHLVGSLREPETDAAYLRQIAEKIHEHGGVLALNWIEAAIARKKDNLQVDDWTPYVEANLEAIKQADVVIADVTHYAFSHGFLIAAALEHKKPTLALSRVPLDSKLASGLRSTLLTCKQYETADDLARTTQDFLKRNTIYTKDLRFNMFLTSQLFQFLEEASKETGRSRSEVIRSLVKRKIEERDHE